MTARVRTVSGREQDERILQAIRLRCEGVEPRRIAAATGLSTDYARAATNRVKAADEKESGEEVAAGYWDFSGDAASSFKWGRLPPRSVPLKVDPPFMTVNRKGVRPPARPVIYGPFNGAEISACVIRSMAESAARECAAMAPFLSEESP